MSDAKTIPFPKEYQNARELDTYRHVWWCFNCGNENHQDIPKGTPAAKAGLACSYCGC